MTTSSHAVSDSWTRSRSRSPAHMATRFYSAIGLRTLLRTLYRVKFRQVNTISVSAIFAVPAFAHYINTQTPSSTIILLRQLGSTNLSSILRHPNRHRSRRNRLSANQHSKTRGYDQMYSRLKHAITSHNFLICAYLVSVWIIQAQTRCCHSATLPTTLLRWVPQGAICFHAVGDMQYSP